MACCAKVRPAKLAMRGGADGNARLAGNKLCAIAYAKHGQALRHGSYIRLRRRRIIYGKRAAGKDNSAQPRLILNRLRTGLYLAVYLQLAYAACDELRVLRAEVEDEDIAPFPWGGRLVLTVTGILLAVHSSGE